MTIQQSATLLINSLAQEKSQKGEIVYNCSAGEPKLPISNIIIESVSNFVYNNNIFYPPSAGDSKLRQEVTKWLNVNYATSFDWTQCAVTVGAKQGLYLLLQYLIQYYFQAMNSRPAVMIAKPFWVSYRDIVKIFDADISYIETSEDSGWKMTVDDLANAYHDNCKLLILNNGCNPSGCIYSQQELVNILDFAKQHKLYVISDEVYSGLVYDNNIYTSCGSFSDYQDIVCVLQSCSKSFAMTGWRVGFIFAQTEIIETIIALLGQNITGVSMINQHAAYIAIQNSTAIIKDIKQQMVLRRDAMLSAFAIHFPDLIIKKPSSALYLFLSLYKLGVKTNMSDNDFCLQFLEQENVATVPGTAFGVPNYIRLSFTATIAEINIAIEKLAKFIKKINNER